MSTQIRPINQTTFHVLYFKYKIYIIPVVACLIAILLVFYLIIPEIQQWFDSQNKMVQVETKINELNQSMNTIKNINSNELDTDVQTATTALPEGKDFADILSSISDAAEQSGTSLGDYSFQVGDLSTTKDLTDSFLQLNITLTGNIDHIRQFVSSLQNEFPISRVIEIHLTSNKSAALTIVFYYKAVPQIAYTADTLLQPLSPDEQKIISSLQSQNSAPIVPPIETIPTPTEVVPVETVPTQAVPTIAPTRVVPTAVTPTQVSPTQTVPTGTPSPSPTGP